MAALWRLSWSMRPTSGSSGRSSIVPVTAATIAASSAALCAEKYAASASAIFAANLSATVSREIESWRVQTTPVRHVEGPAGPFHAVSEHAWFADARKFICHVAKRAWSLLARIESRLGG